MCEQIWSAALVTGAYRWERPKRPCSEEPDGGLREGVLRSREKERGPGPGPAQWVDLGHAALAAERASKHVCSAWKDPALGVSLSACPVPAPSSTARLSEPVATLCSPSSVHVMSASTGADLQVRPSHGRLWRAHNCIAVCGGKKHNWETDGSSIVLEAGSPSPCLLLPLGLLCRRTAACPGWSSPSGCPRSCPIRCSLAPLKVSAQRYFRTSRLMKTWPAPCRPSRLRERRLGVG